MEKPVIKKYNESTHDVKEEFIVAKRTRIAADGEPARVYKRGDRVKVSGGTKKSLYFTNTIFYPDDFEKVKAYEESVKKEFVRDAISKEESDASLSKVSNKKL